MIAVVVDGGRVDGIVTDDPAQVGIEVLVIDYDTEGGTDKDTVSVMRFGTEARAFAHLEPIRRATISLAGVCRAALIKLEAAE